MAATARCRCRSPRTTGRGDVASAGDDRRHDPRALHVIRADGEIDVQQDEDDEEPGEHVMDEPHALEPAEQRGEPREGAEDEPIGVRLPVEGEPGGDHHERHRVEQRVRPLLERVVADEVRLAFRLEGRVAHRRLHQVAHVPGGDGEERGETLELVAGDEPVGAHDPRHHQHRRRGEVDEAHLPHQEVRARLAGGGEVRPADVEAGDDEGEDADRGDPVHRPDRRPPQVHPGEVAMLAREGAPETVDRVARPARRHARRVRHWTFTSTTSRPSASSTCTPHAMHGSNEWIVRSSSRG
jgi:hypothetical protein